MFNKVSLLLDILVTVHNKDTQFSDKGSSAVGKGCKVVGETGSSDQILLVHVGEIFGTIPDRTGSVGCFLGIVGGKENCCLWRSCVVEKMGYIIFQR